MDYYEAIYFDGKLSQPHLAQVRLEPSALRITYKSQDGTLPVTVHWQAHRIEKDEYTEAGKIILRYGNYPSQSLEVASYDFLPVLGKYYTAAPLTHQNGPLQVYRSPPWLWLVLLFFLTLIPVTYFWLLPAAADLAARQIPPTYEQKLGNTLVAQLIRKENIHSLQTAHLRGFVRQVSLPTPYPLRFTVLKNPEPNAFAIPGGNIVVHTGMLKLVQSPAELAALLGHEYGHIKLRHSLRSMFRSLSGYIFISAIIGDVSALTAVILENANTLKSLEYSRDFEKEADMVGLQVLQQHKINPHGMVALFEHLAAHSKGRGQETEFISTHPLLASRISYIKKYMQTQKYPAAPSDSLNYYWQQIKKQEENSH